MCVTKWKKPIWKAYTLYESNYMLLLLLLLSRFSRVRLCATPWTASNGHYRNQIDYILCSQRWRSSIKSAKTRPGADCDSHDELIAKFRLKWKKVWKTTRLFRYDLNQIPYYYMVEMKNRFKGLDLIECLKNYGWRFMTLYRRQWLRPYQEKEMQKGKMVVWGGLTNSYEKKRS